MTNDNTWLGPAMTVSSTTEDDPLRPYTIIEANSWPEDQPINIPSCWPVPGTFQPFWPSPYPERYFAPPATFTPYYEPPLTEETGKEILETLKRIEEKMK